MIAQLETALGTAAESAKQELQEKLDHERAIRLEMEGWYWAISEESLARYQANANGVLLNLPSGKLFRILYTLVWEHVEKREGTDALIRRAPEKAGHEPNRRRSVTADTCCRVWSRRF